VTHRQLVTRAGRWLSGNQKCGVVLMESSTSAYECPDAIGWRGGNHSILVEVKVSRSDFFADKNKVFRVRPKLGMGAYRYFLTPVGLVHPEEVPQGWGLLELHEDRNWVRQKKAAEFFPERNVRNEMNMLYSAMRRIRIGAFIAVEQDALASAKAVEGER
jgi:hypothetical protein